MSACQNVSQPLKGLLKADDSALRHTIIRVLQLTVSMKLLLINYSVAGDFIKVENMSVKSPQQCMYWENYHNGQQTFLSMH